MLVKILGLAAVIIDPLFGLAQAVKLPILGMGGVSKGEDAAQLLLAGASAVAGGAPPVVRLAPLHTPRPPPAGQGWSSGWPRPCKKKPR